MPVLFEIRDDVAIITLNDVAHRNALSRKLVQGMLDGLERSRAHNARAIVVNANGPVFCAGANIRDLLDGWMEPQDPGPNPIEVFQAFEAETRVVIAAVGGGAYGGGFELTMCCDLVVAGSEASFALPELGHGVTPNTGIPKLAQIVGRRKALELILTRRRVNAWEAHALGLVNAVVPAATLLESALALAHEIVDDVPPGAITAAKSDFRRHARVDWVAVRASGAQIPREEWQEGLDAFVEKRKPDFQRFWPKRTMLSK
jgi:enoyl-CoA hydratase/carnithine racemase